VEDTVDIDNTRDLYNWLENGQISKAEKENIEMIIKAFSDYITAVDSEYLYNKTFLKKFIPAFILSNENLNIKKEFLIKLKDSLQEYKENLKIEIDNAWHFDGTKSYEIILLNNFNKSKVNSDKLYYQIKYDGKKSFVIADCVELDKLNRDMDKTIKEVKNLFSDRFKIDYEN
jgi:hypothetical protein